MKERRRHRCAVPCDIEIKAVFHRIWSTDKYRKSDWIELQRMLQLRGVNV